MGARPESRRLYSHRGLRLRRRGAYGPVLTHGPRVVAADAAGAKAVEGALLYFKDRPHLAADRYLPPIVSYASSTEILRLRLRMTSPAGRGARNAGSFPRKERPYRTEEQRKSATHFMCHIRPFQGLGLSAKGLLSSVAYGATPFQRKGAKYCGASHRYHPRPEGPLPLSTQPAADRRP